MKSRNGICMFVLAASLVLVFSPMISLAWATTTKWDYKTANDDSGDHVGAQVVGEPDQYGDYGFIHAEWYSERWPGPAPMTDQLTSMWIDWQLGSQDMQGYVFSEQYPGSYDGVCFHIAAQTGSVFVDTYNQNQWLLTSPWAEVYA